MALSTNILALNDSGRETGSNVPSVPAFLIQNRLSAILAQASMGLAPMRSFANILTIDQVKRSVYQSDVRERLRKIS
jgi:hypothetical protein